MANVNRTKVVTGKNTRLSYFHGWEPVSINNGPEKYSVSVLIPKDDVETINAIQAAIAQKGNQAATYLLLYTNGDKRGRTGFNGGTSGVHESEQI